MDEGPPVLKGLLLQTLESDGEVLSLGIVGGDENINRMHGVRIV